MVAIVVGTHGNGRVGFRPRYVDSEQFLLVVGSLVHSRVVGCSPLASISSSLLFNQSLVTAVLCGGYVRKWQVSAWTVQPPPYCGAAIIK